MCMKCRYSILQGEMGYGISETDDLEEAKRIVKDLNSTLTADEFDNGKDYWILDRETDCSINAYDDETD